MVYTDGVHLVANTLEELHEFASRIGLGRHFYHGVRKGHPHYDLTSEGKKAAAIRAGAWIVDSRRVLLVSKESLNLKIDIATLAKEAVAKYPEKLAEYKSGKKGLLGLFVGEAMKMAKGKADPKELNKKVIEILG